MPCIGLIKRKDSLLPNRYIIQITAVCFFERLSAKESYPHSTVVLPPTDRGEWYPQVFYHIPTLSVASRHCANWACVNPMAVLSYVMKRSVCAKFIRQPPSEFILTIAKKHTTKQPTIGRVITWNHILLLTLFQLYTESPQCLGLSKWNTHI